MKALASFATLFAALFLASCCCYVTPPYKQPPKHLRSAGGGLNGGAVTVSTAPSGGLVGKLTVVFANPSQAVSHPTCWNGTIPVVTFPPIPVGFPLTPFRRYPIYCTPMRPGDTFNPNPTLVWVYPGKITVVQIMYK